MKMIHLLDMTHSKGVYLPTSIGMGRTIIGSDRLSDCFPTNQLAVSQAEDWSTRGPVN